MFTYIERNGKKYELTAQGLSDANTEFVTNWMRKTLENDFDVPEDESEGYAEWAYDRYCEGNGETEYRCVELAYEEYQKDHAPEEEDEEDILPTATCGCCMQCYENGWCDRFQSNVDPDEEGCDHVHGDYIKKVYALDTYMGTYDLEGLSLEKVAKKLGYDPEDIRIMDTI